MPTIRFNRPFSSGSRPTPDPFDKFLDSHGFYRKHTARDSTNLFRVVSEQLYDTQDHHEQVRKDCVNYMIKHREQYERMVQGDFDQYIRKLAKKETYGTQMELRAIGYLYKRNILLYRPFELGTWFVKDDDYKDSTMRVFYATHFDSVFEKSFIIDAAFCQSIAYEMLYKKVFKLPDIEYSVETMLHSDINHEPSQHEYEHGDEYASQIVFEDGRKFQLDRPEDTCCILSDPMRCHFHNKNFEEIIKHDSNRFHKSVLSDKFISCVRQLLFDGITPFPYKVAKALDENMYRNVEFDSWNEARHLEKARKHYFKVGVECLVRLNDTKDDLLKCRIRAKGPNDEQYVVFIEKFGEKRTVPAASLQPLSGMERDMFATRRCDQYAKSEYNKGNNDKFAVYGLRNVKSYTKSQDFDDLIFGRDAICKSIDLEPYISLSNFEFPSDSQQKVIAYPMVYPQTTNMSTNNNSGTNNNNNTSSKIIKGRNQSQVNLNCDANIEKQQQVQITKIEEENSYNTNAHDSKQDFQQAPNAVTGYYQHPSQDQHVDAGSIPVSHQQHVPSQYFHPGVAPVYYCPTSEYSEQNLYPSEMVMPHGVYAIPHAYQAPPMQPAMYAPIAGNQSHYPVPVGGWPGYTPPVNSQGYVLPGPPQYALPAVPAPIPFQLPFLNRELINSKGRINFNLNYAYAPTGDDLPLNDKVSVRFYYNLGIEYFKLLQNVHGHGQLMAMIDGEPNANNNYDQQSSNDHESQPNQLAADIQQLSFADVNEGDVPSPSKPRNYNDNFGYGRRNPNMKYKRNDNRQNNGKHFQGTFQGPMSKTYTKNNPKYMNNQGNQGNNGYDSTPMKDNNGKPHQHGHGGFGSNVPPFPYNSDPNEQHYEHPGNNYTRMTPPGRPSSVPVQAPYYHAHQMHGNYNPPLVSHQIQSQQQQPPPQQQHQQNQSHSLNTSSASNPSQ